MNRKKTKKKLLQIYEELIIENKEQQEFLEQLRIELEYKDNYIRTIEEENLMLKAKIRELEVEHQLAR
ncbi:hypothetical protein [Massilimicrobiota timonensis]|uniref:hypothetical protein n=1 Tax=Massilimicrobiota timonensis TaxID=1776392 RepID=UPI00101DD8AB|nr:hypothetical protein [Massilimicrobiota timonensis]